MHIVVLEYEEEMEVGTAQGRYQQHAHSAPADALLSAETALVGGCVSQASCGPVEAIPEASAESLGDHLAMENEGPIVGTEIETADTMLWPDPNVMPTKAEFAAVMQLANEGNTEALAVLRELLDNHSQIWRYIGDLAVHAETALISSIGGSNLLLIESLTRSVAELKSRLAVPGAGKLEEMAIARVVATWLQLQHVDTLLANAIPGSIQATFLLKRQNQCSRQFDGSMKSLATLRKMLPAVMPTAVTKSRQPVASAASTSDSAGHESGSEMDAGQGSKSNVVSMAAYLSDFRGVACKPTGTTAGR